MLELTLILTGLSHLGGSVSAVARLTIYAKQGRRPSYEWGGCLRIFTD